MALPKHITMPDYKSHREIPSLAVQKECPQVIRVSLKRPQFLLIAQQEATH